MLQHVTYMVRDPEIHTERQGNHDKRHETHSITVSTLVSKSSRQHDLAM